MNIEKLYYNNVKRYVENGTTLMSSKDYRFLVLGGSCWSLVGLGYGLILKGCFQSIALIMITIAVVLISLTFIFSIKKLTLKKRLILDTIIVANWVLQMSLLMAIIYIKSYGVNLYMILLYIPIVLFPIVFGFKTAKNLKKDFSISNKSAGRRGLNSASLALLFGGVCLLLNIKHIPENIVVSVCLICLLFATAFLSIGFLSIQQLYYLFKLGKWEKLYFSRI